MNRQYKRLMKKEEARKKGAPPRAPKPARAGGPGDAAGRRERTKPRQFLREVIAELRKVAWPTRQEVIGYSIVVLVSVLVIAAIIFGLDFVFTEAIYALFGIETS